MNDRVVISNLLVNINNFVDHKYVLVDNKFVRKGKLSLEDAIKFPLCNTKKTTTTEVNKYIRKMCGDLSMTIKKQSVSEKMQFIDPQVYIDMNDVSVMDLYEESREMGSFKDFIVCAIDGSVVELPNDKITRKEFEISENGEPTQNNTTGRVSCLCDVNKCYILSSIITNKKAHEHELALFHLEDIKNKINPNKLIITYDRGYSATSMMLKTEEIGAYYLIRAKKNTFKKKQEKMKTNDETFKISINNSKTKHFHDEKLKEYAMKKRSIKVRAVKVKLKNGTTETLFTNIPPEIATTEELKELYRQRWEIETNYDKLKNKLKIEKFTAKTKVRIEQSFYADIFLFNTLMTIKNDADDNITRTPDKNSKYEYKYQSNFNTLTGEIKELMPELLTNDQEQIRKIVNQIMENASKDLVLTKMDAPTNEEREPKRNYNKKCKISSLESF